MKKKRRDLFRMVALGTAAYAAGAAIVGLLYILFSVISGLGEDVIGIIFLLIMGAGGAFLGGTFLERFLEKNLALKQKNPFLLARRSAFVEFLALSAGAVLLFFIVAAQEAGGGPSEWLAFSVLGLTGVTVLNGVHGAVIAGSLFPEKPRGYFARLSGAMAFVCGILLGLPYLWTMSDLPMSYRGIEYQMLVPVLITIISLGATTGLCMGAYRIRRDRR